MPYKSWQGQGHTHTFKHSDTCRFNALLSSSTLYKRSKYPDKTLTMAATAAQIQDQKFSALGLSKMIVNDAQVCSYSRGLGAASEKNPILVLIHGYPQSSYMYAYLSVRM